MLLAQAPTAPHMDIPIGPLLGIPASLVLLAILLWGIKEPLAWVVVSFLAIGIGFGCLAYGISNAVLLSVPRPVHEVREASMLIGCGAGGTVGGIVLLVVALVRRRKPLGDTRQQPQQSPV